jgi:Raf kinase inhibitor-like YbhB/YbcL family protein
MKNIAKRLILIVSIILIALVGVLAGYDAYAMNADARYHATLMKTLQVTSNDFQNQRQIPVQFSCHGAGISPHISWSGAPGNVRSYALVTTDFDAPAPYLRLFPIVHWVIYNIPPVIGEIGQNVSGEDLEQHHILMGKNISGQETYAPPCPPLGAHQYLFRVYALDLDEIQPASSDKAGVMSAIRDHVLAYGELIGLSSPR